MKRAAVVLAFAFLLLFVQVCWAQAADPPVTPWSDPGLRGRIDPALLKALLTAKPDDFIPAIVVMRAQVPIIRAPGSADSVTSLQAAAAASQVAVSSYLSDQTAAGHAKDVRSFWIFNGLAVRGEPDVIHSLALRDDVQIVRLDRYENRLGAVNLLPVERATGLEWGVQRIGADQVWSAFNDTGTGVVVANMDSGVDFLHPALNQNYRGNLGKGLYQHSGNWFDATSDGMQYPYDGFGHGTHTMGTIAGQGGIGVAPGARWIAVRVLDNRGYGYDSWIHAGFQWILAPNGNPTLAPRVVSNSWSNNEGTSTEFQVDLARLRQAGIVAVFSSGNNGPGPATVGSPASLPGAFAVGASDADDLIASFSSRGPSPWNEYKPLVVAPGTSIRSSTPGGTYALESGTSMAAPHVAGVAALMLSLDPQLTVAAAEHALTSTAAAQNLKVPNNDIGWGRVDAYAAVQSIADAGILSGTVIDSANSMPVAEAQVTARNYATGHSITATCDSNGRYRIGLAAGLYEVTASYFGYQTAAAPPVTINAGRETVSDLALIPLPVGTLRGILADTAGRAITATVSLPGTTVSRQVFGTYELTVPAGIYTVQARSLGYRVVTATVTVASAQVAQQDFVLQTGPRLLLVHSGAWYFQEYPGYFRQSLDNLAYSYDEWRIRDAEADSPTPGLLSKYDLVIWSSPQDAPSFVGASKAITTYLRQGGHLLLTGQDIMFWDGGGASPYAPSYLPQYLKTTFVADDAGSQSVSGTSGDIMAGISAGIADGDGANNQGSPDVLAVRDRDYAAGILDYEEGGLAATRAGLCLPYRAMLLGFGFEALNSQKARDAVMDRAITYLTGPRQAQGLTAEMVSPLTQIGPAGTDITFTLRVRNTAEVGSPVHYQARIASANWASSVTLPDFALWPCESTSLVVKTSAPPSAGIDVRNPLTLTVAPVGLSDLTQIITMTAKTPAPVLLVDDDRWYHGAADYAQAFDLAHMPYDLWQVQNVVSVQAGNPPATRLQWYPMVVWFTGYDWYTPLGSYEETQLGTYLDRGGRLMLSSVFYLATHGDSSFARDRLGALTYTGGMTATASYGSPGHPLGAGLNPAPLNNPFPAAALPTLDAVVEPTAAAQTAWRGDHNRAQAITRSQPDSRVVFWTIPFEALPLDQRAAELARTLGWLGPLGQSSVQVDPPVTAVGGTTDVTLTVSNDGPENLVSVQAVLPPGFEPVSATLPSDWQYDPAGNALTYEAAITSKASQVFRFQLLASGAAPGWSQGKVIYRDRRLSTTFDQPMQIGVAAADLSQSELRVVRVVRAKAATVQLKIRNSGTRPTASASVTGLAPTGTHVVTGTASLVGPGEISDAFDAINWRGILPAGASAAITYQVTIPAGTQPVDLPVEMLAWDGQSGAWEWRKWLQISPLKIYIPIVRK